MSKCDLRVVFDRTDRTYVGGEEVSGTVHVEVNQDVECNRILVEQFWQTHGRGNTATGPKESRVLYKGSLRTGQTLSYPFSFKSPDGPPSYHGRHLNVDHYVHVRVDVPWAIDPKLKEEYVLLPGPRPYGNLPGRAGMSAGTKSKIFAMGTPIGVAMILAGIVLFLPCGLVLIPLGVVAVAFSMWKLLAEKKLGKVHVSWGSTQVLPGHKLPVRLAFTPPKSSRLNKITADLVGKEVCVSGSGTNRTTHTHKLHQQTVILAPECDVKAFRPLQVEGVVPIPETDAFSFQASDNSLVWELQVRIDIPLWPDWVEKRTLVVRPKVKADVVEATLVEDPSAGGRGPAPTIAAPLPSQTGRFVAEDTVVDPDRSMPPVEPPDAEIDDPPGVGESGPEAQEPEPKEAPQPEIPVEEPASPGVGSTAPVLLGIVERLGLADRYSRQREEIIKEQAEQAFDCAVEVIKVERTYSYVPDSRFRSGRTLTGKLRGGDCEVTVQLAETRNEELDALEPGDLVQANCKLLKWNTIYDRLEMREA